MYLSPEFEDLLEMPMFDDLSHETLTKYRVAMQGLGTTPNVERKDVVIDGDSPLRVRLHVPRPIEGSRPVVLSMHGGGFIMGDLNMDDPLFEDWTPSLGLIGVSVDYRLAPETPFPGALDDCFTAWQWVHAKAGEFGFDVARLGVCGQSAGGGLAAALAQRVREEDGRGLAFQLLESPMLDDRCSTPSSQTKRLAIWPRAANEFGWGCYLGEHHGERDMPAYAVPARAADLRGLPPAFISVGGADGFRDEDVAYALQLSQANVPTELHVYPGAPHGYQLFTDSPVALQSRRDARYWLARRLDIAERSDKFRDDRGCA